MKQRTSNNSDAQNTLFIQGHEQAVQLLRRCSTTDGFLASPMPLDNYRRIWARDGVICGLAALLTGEADLIQAFKHTLHTLARHQGPHGEIPSNVDTLTGRISYGGTTGRIDADLWFVIGCAEYWANTADEEFMHLLFPALERVRFLLGAWEFNNRGLLYVPPAGDWADEYLHSGYVLYDQLLYLQAQRSLCALHHARHGSVDHTLVERRDHLKHLIRSNYWFNNGDRLPDDVYHEVLYNKGRAAAPHCCGAYWLPFFSPTGYGYRFDGFANVLASLLDVADATQRQAVDQFIQGVMPEAMPLLPAFHPVIDAVDENWKDLQMTFSYTFKNRPYEFQNGGLWVMITGLYVADLCQRGELELARRLLSAIHTANRNNPHDATWGFYEYHHGQTLVPGGTAQMAWSAAGALIAHYALEGKTVLQIDDRH